MRVRLLSADGLSVSQVASKVLADPPPLLAEVIRVPQRSCRGREDHGLLAQLLQAAADSKHFARELG
ncbi:MAG: hypothetical protein WA622_20545 [Mycobacterium sp.]|uniref:hypothetical protein n=1 Tax=Mycobacterium sp. TaxID=1785 RepID=UPI003BB7D073